MCLNLMQNLVYKIPLSRFSSSTRAAIVKVAGRFYLREGAKMPRRYPAPNYLPARYLGPIVIAERDPEDERKKRRGDRGS